MQIIWRIGYFLDLRQRLITSWKSHTDFLLLKKKDKVYFKKQYIENGISPRFSNQAIKEISEKLRENSHEMKLMKYWPGEVGLPDAFPRRYMELLVYDR